MAWWPPPSPLTKSIISKRLHSCGELDFVYVLKSFISQNIWSDIYSHNKTSIVIKTLHQNINTRNAENLIQNSKWFQSVRTKLLLYVTS
ncbi:hypothetical protein BLOT_004834 [Blomia tropicalis]|nr:hypothetical protein BLOT_004834 [Blomia tropicalis]